MTGLEDGESSLGWDAEAEFDAEGSGWAQKVKGTIPHIEEDEIYLLRNLEKELREKLPVVNNTGEHGDQ